jgi:hypothetical protein
MLLSEIIKDGKFQAKLIRVRKGHNKGENYEYDCKPLFSGNNRGWIILDGFTQSALKAVYDTLSEVMKLQFDQIHIMRLITFAFKHVK